MAETEFGRIMSHMFQIKLKFYMENSDAVYQRVNLASDFFLKKKGIFKVQLEIKDGRSTQNRK